MNHQFLNRFTIIVLAMSIFICFSATAQEKANAKEVKIKTSAFSFMCKNKIESNVKKQDGVESAILDLKNKTVTIKYDTTKANPDSLKKSIESLGYKAEIVNEETKASTDK